VRRAGCRGKILGLEQGLRRFFCRGLQLVKFPVGSSSDVEPGSIGLDDLVESPV
jgi:hypothetical protein